MGFAVGLPVGRSVIGRSSTKGGSGSNGVFVGDNVGFDVGRMEMDGGALG